MTRVTPSSDDVETERAMMDRTEKAVFSSYPNAKSNTGFNNMTINYVRNSANDNRVLVDQNGRPVTVDRMLATRPLRQDLSTRPGPGGRRLTYMSGDGVSRTLNEIFGYEGWSLDIKSASQTGKEQDKRGRWQVSYLAHVRITLTTSGTYKEDMGAGDSSDNNLQTAVAHALKASITDALKRTARHFGDKLGNSLYDSDFAINKAPTNIFEAFSEYERSTREKWGVLNVPNAPGENQQPDGGALYASTTTPTMTASKMPPPPAVHSAAPVPAVTPNVAPKQGNTYQRNSLGSHSSVVSSAASCATPRISTDPAMPMHSSTFSRESHQTRPILTETAVTMNTATRTSGQPIQSINQGGPTAVQPVPIPAQPLVRPSSSWGKRPGGEQTEPAKRLRHNPYA